MHTFPYRIFGTLALGAGLGLAACSSSAGDSATTSDASRSASGSTQGKGKAQSASVLQITGTFAGTGGWTDFTFTACPGDASAKGWLKTKAIEDGGVTDDVVLGPSSEQALGTCDCSTYAGFGPSTDLDPDSDAMGYLVTVGKGDPARLSMWHYQHGPLADGTIDWSVYTLYIDKQSSKHVAVTQALRAKCAEDVTTRDQAIE